MKHTSTGWNAEDHRSAIAVERALAEFRAGRPVLLSQGDATALVVNAESVDAVLAAELETLARGAARLVLPAARLRRLGLDRKIAGVVALPVVDAARVEALALQLDARIDAPVFPAVALDETGLELSALALLLPPVVVVPLPDGLPEGRNDLAVDGEAVRAYRKAAMSKVQLVARAPVPLEDAGDTEFVVFRGGEGMRDQVAIIVGKPDLSGPVTVRLHSACLTGDLFGSLKCDCGDQLRHTVRSMAENEGGILLYLDQEGRGNGIANKMRAYQLQAQGFDTYDADEALGFEHDQRHFDFAAEMLKQLGVTRVCIMTNNPIKMAAIRNAGLELVEDKRILGRSTTHNVRYLESKRDKMGHMIDVEALAAEARVDG